jgi:acyl carrier protein
MADKSDIANYLRQLIAKELNIELATIRDESTFHELGLDSVNSLFLLDEIEGKYTIYIDPLSLFDNPSLTEFTVYLHQQINGRG